MAVRHNNGKTQPPLVSVDPSDGVRAEQHPAAMTQPPPVSVDPSDGVRAEQHPAAMMPGFLRCVICNYLKKIFFNTNIKQYR